MNKPLKVPFGQFAVCHSEKTTGIPIFSDGSCGLDESGRFIVFDPDRACVFLGSLEEAIAYSRQKTSASPDIDCVICNHEGKYFTYSDSGKNSFTYEEPEDEANETPLIKAGKLKIGAILDWLKAEFENNYTIEDYRLLRSPGTFGETGHSFYIQTTQGLYVQIMYVCNGIVKVDAGVLVGNTDLIEYFDYTYVPDDYHLKTYPAESEEAFTAKLNELLGILHSENENIPPCLPDEFIPNTSPEI